MNLIDYISFFLITIVCVFFMYSVFSYRGMYSFYKHFIFPEFLHLTGRFKITKNVSIPFSNLIILFSIISLSLFSMGFGKGLISHLSIKMDSPWVSFVYADTEQDFNDSNYLEKFAQLDLKIENFDLGSDVDSIDTDGDGKDDLTLREFVKNKFLDKYGLEVMPKSIYETNGKFSNPKIGLPKSLMVRKIESDSKLLEELKKSNSFLSKSKHINSAYERYGIIVSAQWLKEFPSQKIESIKLSPYLFLTSDRTLDSGVKKTERLPIPVTGVVKNLPDGVDALVKEELFTMLNQDWTSYDEIPLEGTGRYSDYVNFFVVDTTKDSFRKLKQDFNLVKGNVNYIKKNQRNDILSPNSQIFNVEDLDSVSYFVFISEIEKDPDNFYHIYNYSEVAGSDSDNLSHLMQFKFKKEELGKIESFNDFLSQHDQKLDMSVVKSKENFDLFNKLAISLSAILAFFSIVSVILYITNLVTSHISRNKKNLGTLKAFGLSNNNITFIYSCISLGIVLFAFLSSFLFCEFFGDYFIKYLTHHFFNIQDTSDIFYESYSIYTLCGIFIGIPFLFIYLKLKSSLKGTTPGDLIYERG